MIDAELERVLVNRAYLLFKRKWDAAMSDNSFYENHVNGQISELHHTFQLLGYKFPDDPDPQFDYKARQ